MDLFVPGDGDLLNTTGSVWFHFITAKLLYLAKRARPDLLTAVAYLTTRVSSPTAIDSGMVSRVLRYLNSTRDLGLTLGTQDELVVIAYVDASYEVHCVFKSHTGSVLALGVPFKERLHRQSLGDNRLGTIAMLSSVQHNQVLKINF
jgi:hypothetical protein